MPLQRVTFQPHQGLHFSLSAEVWKSDLESHSVGVPLQAPCRHPPALF